MRLFTRQGQKRGIRMEPEIARPTGVAFEPVRIKFRFADSRLLEADGSDAGYVALYLDQDDAVKVGKLAGLVSPSAEVPSDSDMICEAHPTEVWPHLLVGTLDSSRPDCSGPGVPWQDGLRLLKEARDNVRRLGLELSSMMRQRDDHRQERDNLERSLTTVQRARDQLQRKLDEAWLPMPVVGVALEDAKEGEFLRIRVDPAAREQIEESLKDVIFNDAKLTRHAPLGGLIRTLLDLRGYERIPEPEPEPEVVSGPREGYKRVALTYFTGSGQRYTDGEFYTPEDRFDFNTYALVERLRADEDLPGLMDGLWSDGAILVQPEDGVEVLLPAIR